MIKKIVEAKKTNKKKHSRLDILPGMLSKYFQT